jgi:hypothetical protein
MPVRKFGGKNNLRSTRQIFNERAKYHNDAVTKRVSEQYPGLFRDFWFIENMYYGKIDREHRFLIVKQEKIKALKLQTDKSIFLVDFVADAMVDFLKEHEKALVSGKIRKGGDTLSFLGPEKGYTNVLYDYDLHVTSIRDEVHNIMASNHKRIENFDDFVEFFLEYVLTNGKNMPLTLTGFIASRLSSPSTTGLFMELASMHYDKDQEKIDDLLDHQNYKFFIKNSLKHGFLIDYNIPWRVCANIGSNEMESYMYKYGVNSQSVFEEYYDFTYARDAEYIMKYLYKFYNRFVSLRPYIRREKYMNDRGLQVHRYVDRRKRLTKEKLERDYNDEYKINLYVNIRNYEAQNRYSLALTDNIKENAIAYLKTKDIDTAYEYINHQFVGFLNDPYAYNGFMIREEAKKNNDQTTGQDLQDLLNDSVVDSRKTFY